MTKKKNNAVEKTEKAIKNNKKDSRSKPKKMSKDEKLVKKQKARQQKLLERQQLKTERERIRAQKEIELSKIRSERQLEREKVQANRVRERERRKTLLAQQKLERKQKKDQLKNERKQKNKDRRQGTGGWIASTIALGITSLVLASLLAFNFLVPSSSDNLLQTGYAKSFYSTVEQIDNIDLNLSKILASKDNVAMQKYLVDTAINSEIAENELHQLPLHDESKAGTTKLINQIGDYAKYLNNKLANGEKITKMDIESLASLQQSTRKLKQSFSLMSEKIANGYSFESLASAKDGDPLLAEFSNLQNLSTSFPELIYDGPFSDGINDREIKGVHGEEINGERAKQKFIEIFGAYNLEDVTLVGETNTDIVCYNVQANVDGDLLYAQISRTGGHLIMCDYAGDCDQEVYDQAECIEKGEEFLKSVGIKNIKPVWVNLASNVYTINFAYTIDDVIVYSDLVKVRVCSETNKVIGFEGSSYYTNHTERTVETPKISEQVARSKVNDDIEILSSRLAIVPVGTASEKLCYEFSGDYNGETFYVYIDATNGRQVEMFKVISSTEGELLM